MPKGSIFVMPGFETRFYGRPAHSLIRGNKYGRHKNMELSPQCLQDRRVGIVYVCEFKSAEVCNCKWQNVRIMFLNISAIYV